MKRKRISFNGKINAELLPKNVKIDGSDLVFAGYDDDTIKGICKRMSGLIGAANYEKYKATEADRQLIVEKIADESVDVSTFGIYRAVVSSTQTDTTRDKFSELVLREMGAQYKDGRTVVLGHDMYAAVGQTFDAEVIATSESDFELYVKFYVLPGLTTVTGGEVRTMLNVGAYKRFSIGAFMKIVDIVRDEDTGYRTYFYDHTNIVVAHLGIVDMGANTDAMSKSASGDGLSFGQIKTENEMSLFQKNYKSIGSISIELEKEPVEALLDSIEKSVSEKLEKLAGFEAAEAENLKSLRDDWSAKKKTINPEADAAKLEARANLLTADILAEDIAEMKKAIAGKIAKTQTKGGKAGGEGVEQQLEIMI